MFWILCQVFARLNYNENRDILAVDHTFHIIASISKVQINSLSALFYYKIRTCWLFASLSIFSRYQQIRLVRWLVPARLYSCSGPGPSTWIKFTNIFYTKPLARGWTCLLQALYRSCLRQFQIYRVCRLWINLIHYHRQERSEIGKFDVNMDKKMKDENVFLVSSIWYFLFSAWKFDNS